MSSVGGTDDVPWDDVGFVISPRYHISVLGRLSGGSATPTQIATDSENAVAHVSRALQEFRDRSLVELLVPKQRRKGRVYGITDDAENIWHVIRTQQMA